MTTWSRMRNWLRHPGTAIKPKKCTTVRLDTSKNKKIKPEHPVFFIIFEIECLSEQFEWFTLSSPVWSSIFLFRETSLTRYLTLIWVGCVAQRRIHTFPKGISAKVKETDRHKILSRLAYLTLSVTTRTPCNFQKTDKKDCIHIIVISFYIRLNAVKHYQLFVLFLDVFHGSHFQTAVFWRSEQLQWKATKTKLKYCSIRH